MANMVVIFFLVAIVFMQTNGASITEGNTLIPLKYPGVQPKGTRDYQEYYYYLSPQPAIWSDAVLDCKKQLGPTAHLVSFEEPEEATFVDKMLDNSGLGTEYWTAGRFNVTAWVWDNSGDVLGTWSPWNKPNHPPNNPNSLLRVFMSNAVSQGSKWEVASFSRTLRYICETDD